MKPKNSGSGRRIVCLVLVAVMLLGLISSALIIMVNAASSSEIKKELNGLRSQQAELKKEREALQAKIKENQSKTQTLVEKKSDIDQQISMTQASIDNLNEQVQQYSLLIANKQADLEASQAEEQRLNTQYKTRIRSMEETGSISYWAILFGANSFSDLLDKIDVIQEIAKADQQMLKKMKAVSEQIAAERAELEQQMAELDATRQELDQQEQDLEAQRAEQDTLLTEMLAAYEEMNADYMQNMADEAALSEEIAKHRPNDKVTVGVKKGSDVKQIEVVLRNKAGNTEVITKDIVSAYDALGGQFAEVSERTKKALKIGGGVQVVGIEPGGILESARIRKGYIITNINDRPVRSIGDLNRITSKIEYIEGVYPDGRVVAYSPTVK